MGHARFFDKILFKLFPSVFHPHHEAIIDATTTQGPSFDSLSESQRVERALYALWKIRQVNHHFFPPSEADLIDNRELRIARLTFRQLTLAGVAGYWGFSVSTNRFRLKTLAVGLGVLAVGRAALLGTEVFYDAAKKPFRKSLARKYMEVYGAKELYEISRPTYPIAHLEHLHNKLY